MRNLAQLVEECAKHGINVSPTGRSSKETYIAALRAHLWRSQMGDREMPHQILPMLLSEWSDLDQITGDQIERDASDWIVQKKLDGVRALLHVNDGGIRLTGRCISEVNFRVGEFHGNVPHLAVGLEHLAGTILDGELVCPISEIRTGATVTQNALQAAVAILATTPDKSREIQASQSAFLQFHAFDVLKFAHADITGEPLRQRAEILEERLASVSNPHVVVVPTVRTGKRTFHQNIIDAGGEGTVWKRDDQPYQPGCRVHHWVKRKRALEIEAFVTGSKPGTEGRGHADRVGAVEFSIKQDDGAATPIGWISAWNDQDRSAMTCVTDGTVNLNPAYLGRRALITGLDLSAKSRRLRHARLVRWL